MVDLVAYMHIIQEFYAGRLSILELRKEKSRDAARSRRGKENYEYYELAKMLPLPQAITSQLDKASIIRLTISFLKLKDFSCHGDPPWQREQCSPGNKAVSKGASRRRSSSLTDVFETHHGTHILQSLDGFAFALSNDGRFLYISETVSIYLGLSQVEMTGSSMFDYVHIQDHQELAEQLGLDNPGTPSRTTSSTSATLASNTNPTSSSGTDQDQDSSSSSRAVTPTVPDRTSIMTPSMSKGYERSFCIRMKSTLTKRGVHVKCSGYRVVQLLAQMRPQFSFNLARKHPPPIMGLVGMAIALPPPTITELIIDNDMFVSRFSPELNVTYVEPKISEMMDICSEDLTGESLYNHCHAEDLQKLRKAHIDLLSKGQVLTDYYRLMNKHGGYVWLQTCATVVYNSKNQDEQNIIGINYVLSGVEYPGCVMDMNQLSTLPSHHHDHSDHSESEHDRNLPHDSHQSPSPSQDFGAPRLPGNSHSRRAGFMRGHKRKHPPNGQDDNSVAQLLEFGSPPQPLQPPIPQHHNSFQMIYPPPQDTSDMDPSMNGAYNDDGTLLGDDKHLKQQHHHDFNKNSRRKMDKPRKRKKDLEDLQRHGGAKTNKHKDVDVMHSKGPVPEHLVADLHSEIASLEDTVVEVASHVSRRPDSVHSLPTSPNNNTASTNEQRDVANIATAAHSSTTPASPPIPAEDLRVSSPPQPPQINMTAPVSSPRLNDSTSSADTPLTYINGIDKWPSVTTTTVSSTSSSSPPLYPSEASAVTTSSSSVRDLEEVMNKHLPMSAGEAEHLRNEYTQSLLGLQKHHKSAIQWVGPAVQNSNDLTATNLLRSLYANRETVIRSNVYNPRPQYYSESVQTSLLTPPGGTTDLYKDSFSKTTHTPTTYDNLHYTPSNSLSVSMTTAGMNDSYSMTPPSSVSPQEKYASLYGDHQLAPPPPAQYDNGGGVSMPIKPQAYPLPAHNNSQLTGYDRASQYAATAAYYSPAYAHSTHYRDTTKNATW